MAGIGYTSPAPMARSAPNNEHRTARDGAHDSGGPASTFHPNSNLRRIKPNAILTPKPEKLYQGKVEVS